MEEKLRKKFYKRFWIALIVGVIGFAILITISIITLVDYLKTNEKLYLPIIFFVFLVGLTIWEIVDILPYIKDLKAVKNNDFEKFVGEVVGFRKVELGGEPPEIEYYPILRNNATGKEMELKIEGLQLKKNYTFLYLKHTKLAVVNERVINNFSIKLNKF